MKSLLFIGGTGFLGQSFFDFLNKNKLKFLKLSEIILVSRKKKKIESKIKLSFLNENIKNIKSIPITDYIIYAANSANNKENLEGFYNFKKLLTDNHKKSKILFTSSGAVYGKKIIKKKMNEKDLISLNKVKNFNGYKKEYAKTKIIIEREFCQLGKIGFNVIIARLFSFIGRRILDNNHFAITNLISQAKNNKAIKLNDSRDVYRGFMNSDDLVNWIIKIMLNADTKCKIYNVGSDQAITIKDLAELIGKKYNKQVIKSIENLNNEIDYYVPSILKAKKNLKLKLKYDIKKSLEQLIGSHFKKSHS